jgi:hypothetical protein
VPGIFSGGGGVKDGRRVRLTTLPPSVSRLSTENVGTSTSHDPMGLRGLLQGEIYLFNLRSANSSILRDIMPCSPLKVQVASRVCYLIHAGFLPGLFFDPDDGGDMFLRKLRLSFNGVWSRCFLKKRQLCCTEVRSVISHKLELTSHPSVKLRSEPISSTLIIFTRA